MFPPTFTNDIIHDLHSYISGFTECAAGYHMCQSHDLPENTFSVSITKTLILNCYVCKKVKVGLRVYSLISSISSDFYIFTSWWLDLFIRVASQLHGEHTVLQPFRRIELIIHIVIGVLTGMPTHFHLS